MFKISSLVVVLIAILFIVCCLSSQPSSFIVRKDDVYTFTKDTRRGVFPFTGGYHVKVFGDKDKKDKNEEIYVANYVFDYYIEKEQIDQYLFKGRVIRYNKANYDTFEISDAFRLMPYSISTNSEQNTLYYITNNSLVTEYYTEKESIVKGITEPYTKEINNLHMEWFNHNLYFSFVNGKFENDVFNVHKLYIRVDINCGRNLGQSCPENKNTPTYKYDQNQCIRNTGCVKPSPNCPNKQVLCKKGLIKSGFPAHPDGCQLDFCWVSFLFFNQTSTFVTQTQPTREEWAKMRQQFENRRY